MHSVTLGIYPTPQNLFGVSEDIFSAAVSPDMANSPPTGDLSAPCNNNALGAMDPAQLHHLAHLLSTAQGAAPPALAAASKQTAIVECPKSMVGRVIGKGGETIKSLQQYTGAMIQIDQSTDPTRVTIAGSPHSLQLAVSMVNDIVRGTFKGFAMLRQIAIATTAAAAAGPYAQPQPTYVQGYGFVPPSQVFNPEDPMAAAAVAGVGVGAPPLMRGVGGIGGPSGPLTPPITPLRAPENATNNMMGGGFPDTGLAALLGAQQQQQHQQQQQQQFAGQQQGFGGMANFGGQDASLIAALLSQLTVNQQQQQQQPPPPAFGMAPPQQQPHQQQPNFQSLLTQSLVSGANNAGGFYPSAGAGIGQQNSYNSAPAPSPAPSASAPLSPSFLGIGGVTTTTAAPAGSSPSLGGGSNSSGRASPGVLGGLQAASNPTLARARDSGSRDSSPLGRYGAIGSGSKSPVSGNVTGVGGAIIGSPNATADQHLHSLWGTHNSSAANVNDSRQQQQNHHHHHHQQQQQQ